MSLIASAELDSIKDAILNTVPVERIYLFGSYAYGTSQESSDIDIYVVIKDDSPMRATDAITSINKAIYPIKTVPTNIMVSKRSRFDDVDEAAGTIGIRLAGSGYFNTSYHYSLTIAAAGYRSAIVDDFKAYYPLPAVTAEWTESGTLVLSWPFDYHSYYFEKYVRLYLDDGSGTWEIPASGYSYHTVLGRHGIWIYNSNFELDKVYTLTMIDSYPKGTYEPYVLTGIIPVAPTAPAAPASFSLESVDEDEAAPVLDAEKRLKLALLKAPAAGSRGMPGVPGTAARAARAAARAGSRGVLGTALRAAALSLSRVMAGSLSGAALPLPLLPLPLPPRLRP